MKSRAEKELERLYRSAPHVDKSLVMEQYPTLYRQRLNRLRLRKSRIGFVV